MNQLLPKKEELIPITKGTSTFYDCGFNEEFDKLPFIKKLQIINDLVRQTILPKICCDVDMEKDTLIGNCHTASLISIDYLKDLGIGKNHRYVLARRKQYEPVDITTKHALVLVDDDYGNTYEFDATPYVGYGYGKVKLKNSEPLYEEYIELDESKIQLLHELRKFLYEQENRLLTDEKIEYYLKIFEAASKIEIFNGFTSYCYKLLFNYPISTLDKQELRRQSIIYNPYNTLNPNKSYLERKKEMALIQIEKWQQEFEILKKDAELIQKNGIIAPNSYDREVYQMNLKSQLELAQWIVQEMKLLDIDYERSLLFKNKEIKLSHLTPRFYYENGLNVAIIKSSAYHLGVRGTIRERILDKGNGAIGEYFANLSAPTKDTGLVPILYSHALGNEYERSMTGQADVFLINDNAESLYKKKKELREELGKNIYYKNVTWLDGESIIWHPFVTNLIHSTDNPSEAALHYLMAYPEHQVMTRFMYPNHKLEKVLKNERI